MEYTKPRHTREQIEQARQTLRALFYRIEDDAKEELATAAEIEDEDERAEAMQSARETQEEADALSVALDALTQELESLPADEANCPEGRR